MRANSSHHGQRFPNRILVQPHDAGPPLELVRADAGKRTARAAGGQRVARTCQEIPDRDRRVVPQIDRARRADLRQPAVLVRGDQRNVLRREGVGKWRRPPRTISMQQEGAALEHLADDFRAGKSR